MQNSVSYYFMQNIVLLFLLIKPYNYFSEAWPPTGILFKMASR